MRCTLGESLDSLECKPKGVRGCEGGKAANGAITRPSRCDAPSLHSTCYARDRLQVRRSPFCFFSLSLTACRGTDGLVIGVVSDDADADAQAYVICHTLFKQRTGTGKRASEDDGSIRSHVKRHVWMASLVAPSQSN